jgi:hypothetical protein
MVKAVGFAIVAALCSRDARAQVPRGGAVTTLNGDSVSVTFVRAWFAGASRSDERLVAIVIFTGQPGWTATPREAADRLQAREDSVKASTAAGLLTGGVISDQVVARVSYDAKRSQLWVDSRPLTVGSPDSTLVIVTSAVDSPRARTSVARAVAPLPIVGEPGGDVGPAIPASWWAVLEGEPRLRTYAASVFRP